MLLQCYLNVIRVAEHVNENFLIEFGTKTKGHIKTIIYGVDNFYQNNEWAQWIFGGISII